MGRGHGSSRAGLAGACLLAACMAALAVVDPPFLSRWGERAQDVILGLVPLVRSESACVIVAADEKSRREVGPWPWPDETAGRLVELISRGNPRAIGIVSCPASSGAGHAFADALRSAKSVVVGYTLAPGRSSSPAGSSIPPQSRIRYVTNPWGKARGYRMPSAAGVECADAAPAGAAIGAGFLNPFSPGEEFARKAPLVCTEGDGVLMSFALALVSAALGTEKVTLQLMGDAVVGIELDGRLIPTDARGMLRLRPPFPGVYPEIISASEVLLGNSEPGRWAGKIVLIGECEAPVPAPVRGRLPSAAPPVVLNAGSVDALLGGNYLRRSRLMALLELVFAALFPFIARGAFRRRGRAWLKWGSLAAVLIGCVGAEILALAGWGEEIRPFYPALSAAVSWAVYAALRGRKRGPSTG